MVVNENTITCDVAVRTRRHNMQVKVTNVYGYSVNISADNFTYIAGPTVTINQAVAQADPTGCVADQLHRGLQRVGGRLRHR